MHEYLNALQTVLNHGSWTPNRATLHGKPIRTLTYPGLVFRHDLAHGFPLLTTKKVPLRLVASELEFFIQGKHRKEDLHTADNHIWDEWQAPGQNDPNELGRIYGVQWRRWQVYEPVRGPGPATHEASSYIDQLKCLISTLQQNPFDRRTVVTAWNPAENDRMALPSCHMIWQTVVTMDGRPAGLEPAPRLHLCMTMRSADLMLGVPFNVASYALLLLLLSKHTNMTPGILTVTMNNAHIYEHHLDGAKTQMLRQPMILPEVKILNHADGTPFDLFRWKYTDLELTRYNPHPAIKMEVAV